MHQLNVSTLQNISKYKSDALKLSAFFTQSDSSIFTSALSKTTMDASEIDLLAAFEKDLNSTCKTIEKSLTLLASTNSDGIVTASDDKFQIKDLFGEFYDNQKNTVSISNIPFNLGHKYSKDDIKEYLLKDMFGIYPNDFKTLKKQAKSIFSLSSNSVYTEEDALKYLAQKPLRSKHEPLLNKINNIIDDNQLSRSKYASEETNNSTTLSFIDKEITGSRAMVDSIIKDSTHITSGKVLQQSKSHKSELDNLTKSLSTNNNISDIEIDSSVDLRKITNLVDQISDLELNLDKQFTLKARKLGNYRAHGLCMPSISMVAIDIKAPSSLIHELTHLVDLTNETIKNDPLRLSFADKFRQKIDSSELPGGKESYFTCDNEIIARLGEVAYLLKANDYQGEKFSDFVDKVRKKESDLSDICVIKPIDHYLQNSNIYFGFGDDEILSNKDLMQIKDFYSAYWGIGEKPIPKISVDSSDYPPLKTTKKVKKTAQNFVQTSFSDFSEHTIVDSYKLCKDTDFISPVDFSSRIIENMKHLSRHKKRISGGEVISQFNTVNNLYNHIFNNEDQDIKNQTFISLLKNTANFDFISTSQLKNTLKGHPHIYSLFENACKESESGFLSIIKNNSPAYDYLNTYGVELAEKNFYTLQASFLKTVSNDDFNKILDEITPSSYAYYKSVFLRVALTKDNPDMFPQLIQKLSDDNTLSLFSNQTTIFIANSLASSFRKFSKLSDLEGNIQNQDLFSNLSNLNLTPATEWQSIANNHLGIESEHLNYFAINQDGAILPIGSFSDRSLALHQATNMHGDDIVIFDHNEGQDLKSFPFNTNEPTIAIAKDGTLTSGSYPSILESDNPPTIVVDTSLAMGWSSDLDKTLPNSKSTILQK